MTYPHRPYFGAAIGPRYGSHRHPAKFAAARNNGKWYDMVLLDQWRRDRSQLVFQAIQAVLAVAGTSIARANPDDAERYPLSYCRELCTQSGWVKL